jgi:hypothetical protein
MTASHAGYQIKLDPQQGVAATADEDEDEDGIDEKELGIALFLIILVGCITAIYFPGLSIACGIAATVIASVLTCLSCFLPGNYRVITGILPGTSDLGQS